MIERTTLLEIQDAMPLFEESNLPPCIFNLKVMPGDCIIIECRDPVTSSAFADLCSGMIPLETGAVYFNNLDWGKLKEPRLSALRGRIGRITQKGSWIDMYPMSINILLPLLHHTKLDLKDITSEAMELCYDFDLPGIPIDSPRHLSSIDLARAACVRAFLGQPDLLLFEYPLENYAAELSVPFMTMLNNAQNRGAGIICFTRQLSIWSNYRQNVTQWMNLQERGLTVSGSYSVDV